MSANTDSTARPRSQADRARKPHASTAATRERIVTAAISVFATWGYHNASLLEIADQVGMTHAGVLHYFGTKDNLLTAVLERREESGIDAYEGHRLPTGAALLEHLVKTARGNAERAGKVQAYAVVGGVGHREPPGTRLFPRSVQGAAHDRRGRVAGSGSPAVPEDEIVRAASLIIATMDGLQVQWLLEPDVIDMASRVETAINGVLARLRAGTEHSAT